MLRYLQSKKSLVGAVGLLVIVGGLVNVAGIVAGFLVARRLDTASYGQFAYTVNIYLLLSVFFGFGLTGQVTKDLAAATDVTLMRSQLSGLLALRLVTAGLMLIGGAGLAFVTNNPANLWAGAGATLYVYTDFVGGVLSGRGYIKSLALALLAQPLTYLVLLVVLPTNDLNSLYAIFLAAQIAGATCATLLLIVHSPIRVWPRAGAMRRLVWKDMVAGEVYLLVLLQTGFGAVGVTVLGALGQYDDAGAFSIAMTVIQVPNLLFSLVIGKLYYPRMCGLAQNGTRAEVAQVLQIAYYLSAAFTVGYVALIIVYGDVVVTVLYSSAHADAIGVTRWLALLSFFQMAVQLLTWTDAAFNRMGRVVKANLMALLSLLIVWPLGAIFGIEMGAGQVALVYTLSGLLCWLLLMRSSLLSPRQVAVSTVLISAMLVLALVIAAGLRYVLPTAPELLWQVGQVACAGLIYGLCSSVIAWGWWGNRRPNRQTL